MDSILALDSTSSLVCKSIAQSMQIAIDELLPLQLYHQQLIQLTDPFPRFSNNLLVQVSPMQWLKQLIKIKSNIFIIYSYMTAELYTTLGLTMQTELLTLPSSAKNSRKIQQCHCQILNMKFAATSKTKVIHIQHEHILQIYQSISNNHNLCEERRIEHHCDLYRHFQLMEFPPQVEHLRKHLLMHSIIQN